MKDRGMSWTISGAQRMGKANRVDKEWRVKQLGWLQTYIGQKRRTNLKF